jgi:mannosyltransferase
LLVPTGDVTTLAAALESLMRNPEAAAAMGRRAREFVVANYSLDAEASGIAAVYRTLL